MRVLSFRSPSGRRDQITFDIGRRHFITPLGGAAVAWPIGARAQQAPLPVIGYVNSGTADANVKNIDAFRAGLTEVGFVEGQNVAIEFR